MIVDCVWSVSYIVSERVSGQSLRVSTAQSQNRLIVLQSLFFVFLCSPLLFLHLLFHHLFHFFLLPPCKFSLPGIPICRGHAAHDDLVVLGFDLDGHCLP